GGGERLLDGPLPLLFPGDGTRNRVALSGQAQPFGGALRGLRVGASAAFTRSTTRPASPLGFTAETVNGLPARAWSYGWAGPESRWRGIDVGAFAARRIDHGRISADLGLRFDFTNASAEGASPSIDWYGLSPRISVRGRVSDSLSLLGGWARYRQRLPLGLLPFPAPPGPPPPFYRWRDPDRDGTFEPRELRSLIAVVGPGGSFSTIDPDLKAPH